MEKRVTNLLEYYELVLGMIKMATGKKITRRQIKVLGYIYIRSRGLGVIDTGIRRGASEYFRCASATIDQHIYKLQQEGWIEGEKIKGNIMKVLEYASKRKEVTIKIRYNVNKAQ